ncbi:MAG: PAS domain S-box protein [Burkholderiaceae bacterium]|nr:PAS domain S-box protein [Burkholderiaceae bacterium]
MNHPPDRPEPAAADPATATERALSADPAPPGGSAPIGAAHPQLYEQIFYAATDALVVVDRDGVIRLANRQSERLFGHAASELVGRPIEELIPQRFREGHRRHRSLYAERPESRPMGMNLALWAQHADGREFPVEISLSPFRLDGATMVCANIRDVSEVARVQDLLARARQSNAVADFGRLALASKDIGLIQREACDLVARLLHVDYALVAQCAGAEPLLAPAASHGLGDAALAAALARLAECCRQDATPLVQPMIIDDLGQAAPRADDDETEAAPRSALVAPIPGDERTLGLLMAGAQRTRSFTRDDANFMQALANTIGAAMQRSRTEEQLFQSQRLEALGQLTGGVAHDFNNLLTVISGNLQMLEERVAADALSANLVKAALRATGRGADLTRKLLAFARRQTLRPSAIDARQLLASLADILARTLGANIDVHSVVDDGLPPIKADPGMLDTALLNLAVNARDAMPNGGTLVFSARLADVDAGFAARADGLAPGRYLLVSVADSGAGMSDEVLARAFEPFFTTKENGKGSGLGLSLVYGFAKQSGGHVQATSTPGIGTTVNLYLPVDPGDALPRADFEADVPCHGGSETILVVEDDEEVREIATAFLRKLGYRVLEATGAQGALALLDREPGIDLLFSDVVLRGGISGPALAREALARRPKLRVAFASGYARSALPWRAELGRGVELLSKPYRIDQLARTLRRALDRAPGELRGNHEAHRRPREERPPEEE